MAACWWPVEEEFQRSKVLRMGSAGGGMTGCGGGISVGVEWRRCGEEMGFRWQGAGGRGRREARSTVEGGLTWRGREIAVRRVSTLLRCRRRNELGSRLAQFIAFALPNCLERLCRDSSFSSSC